MDCRNKKIVAYSFFDQTPDVFDVKDALRKTLGRKIKLEALRSLNQSDQNEADKIWRPSTAFCLSVRENGKGGTIDEYHLFYQPTHRNYGKSQKLGAEWIKDSIQRLSPRTKVILEPIDIGDAHDFQIVYTSLWNFFSKKCSFPDREHTRYLVNVTAGSQVVQMCLCLLADRRIVPAELVQVYRDQHAHNPAVGKCNITNVVLSSQEYDKGPVHDKQAEETRQGEKDLKGGVKTRNRKYNDLISEILNVAQRTNDPILLTGPTGAGKTRLASLIYQQKHNTQGAFNLTGNFISVNCATLTGNLVESTLFGHVKGAFTDAHSDRDGCIKKANGGLLFLDEIGCLPAETQGKLLTVLDKGKFTPLGGDEEEESHFQLICATNEDLFDRVKSKEHHFRLDLLERIRTWSYEMPGLADRREDINPNIDGILINLQKKYGIRKVLTEDARKRFLEYAMDPDTKWEGNFRELIRFITRVYTLSDDEIKIETVEKEIKKIKEEKRKEESAPQKHPPEPVWQQTHPLEEIVVGRLLGPDPTQHLDPIDLEQFKYAVKICGQSKTSAEAARKLFAKKARTQRGFNAAACMRNYFNRQEVKNILMSIHPNDKDINGFKIIHEAWIAADAQSVDSTT